MAPGVLCVAGVCARQQHLGFVGAQHFLNLGRSLELMQLITYADPWTAEQ